MPYYLNYLKLYRRRKSENMSNHNLYALISDRLSMYNEEFPTGLYNTLYEVRIPKCFKL